MDANEIYPYGNANNVSRLMEIPETTDFISKTGQPSNHPINILGEPLSTLNTSQISTQMNGKFILPELNKGAIVLSK